MAAASLAALRTRLEAKYKASAELFPDFTTIKEIAVIPTSSMIINAVSGIGGFPRGRMTEVSGAYSSGKTTIATQAGVCLQAIQKDSVIVYLDFEHAFDPAYAHKLGLDLTPDRFVFAQPEYFEQGHDIVDQLVSNDLVDFIVVDSAAAMTPKDELEGKVDGSASQRIGLQSALMARFLSAITKKINKGRKPALVMLNQTRANIDIKNPRASGGEKPAGGSALKFYASMRLQLSILAGEGDSERDAKSATDQVYTQNRVRVVCIKNKVAPPFARGTFSMDFGTGVNNLSSICELAESKLGIIGSTGHFKYTGDTQETTIMGRGRETFMDSVKGNPALALELEKKVTAVIRAEQAATLGLKEIVSSGRAKEIEDETVVLEGMPSTETA